MLGNISKVAYSVHQPNPLYLACSECPHARYKMLSMSLTGQSLLDCRYVVTNGLLFGLHLSTRRQ